MAVLPFWVACLASAARNAGGFLCSDGDAVVTIDDVSGNGATFVPDPTTPPIIRIYQGIKYFTFPAGAVASRIRINYPPIPGSNARLIQNLSIITHFQAARIANTTGLTSYCLWSTTNNSAGTQCRVILSQSLSASAYGGSMSCVDPNSVVIKLEKYAPNSGGGTSAPNGSPVKIGNIATFRIQAGTIRSYVNGTDYEINQAFNNAAGTHTALFLGSHNSTPNTFNMAGGMSAGMWIVDSAASAADMADTYDSIRAQFPFLAAVDHTEPCLYEMVTSSGTGLITTTGRSYWEKMFNTDLAINWPGGMPQWLLMGSPGTSAADIRSMWENSALPDIPANAARPILWYSAAVSNIRSHAQTPLATYNAAVLMAADFLAAFPNGYFVIDSTTPSATENPDLEAYDALVKAQFSSSYFCGPHVRRGIGAFSDHCFYVDIRDALTTIGGLGNNVSGAAANWTNTPGNYPATPNNVHNKYSNDANHRCDTVIQGQGQTDYLNEFLTLFQILLGPGPAPPVSFASFEDYAWMLQRKFLN